ncbi:MAG: tRNA pseudouridine(38-40) synthase TruA [Alistipes sp.]|nr:tRNA pseudouridine(38-40) synthase TruA [Alistipes sp.]
MRYFMELQYEGGAYFGWQRQKEQSSVQQTLERTLSMLLREEVEVTGAGRTDTGVSACYYVAHFDVEARLEDTKQVVYKLNRILPRDIAVHTLTEVSEEAHARFSAVEREYRYYIEQRKNPFTVGQTWQYAVALDVERMNRAAEVLMQVEDFTTFAKLNSNNKTNICHLAVARWEVEADGTLCFTIRGDRFLRNMVRAIVGTLVDVGRGRYSVEEFRAIVLSRDLSRASSGAPAEGLYLSDVRYPATLFERKTFY